MKDGFIQVSFICLLSWYLGTIAILTHREKMNCQKFLTIYLDITNFLLQKNCFNYKQVKFLKSRSFENQHFLNVHTYFFQETLVTMTMMVTSTLWTG